MIAERITTPHRLDNLTFGPGEIHPIGNQNWVKTRQVRVSFGIQHDRSNIYLGYWVEEDQVRAVNSEFNSPVWEDSCVEFFFSLAGDDKNYYNFEFNAIGAVLGAYGRNRDHRNLLDQSLLEQVETLSSLGHKPIGIINEPTTWRLFVKIPAGILKFNQVTELAGLDAHCNFYKCGDKLDHPHYLSWKPVLTPIPDFHTPGFFGQLSFL